MLQAQSTLPTKVHYLETQAACLGPKTHTDHVTYPVDHHPGGLLDDVSAYEL